MGRSYAKTKAIGINKPVTLSNAEIIALKAKDNSFIVQIPRTVYWLYCARLENGWQVFLVKPRSRANPLLAAESISTRTLSKLTAKIINKHALV